MSNWSIREKLRLMLRSGESPHRLALAFATGVFISCCPLIIGHTVLALGAIWAMRFNPVAVFTGAFINNPWTFVPLYGFCLWLGVTLWPPENGTPPLALTGLSVTEITELLKPVLMPFILGSLLVSTLGAVVGYVVIKAMATSYQQRRDETPPG